MIGLLVWKRTCAAGLAALAAGCSAGSTADAPADARVAPTLARASDVPIDGMPAEDVRLFREGDAIFDLPFRESDGLGPLYVRDACGACHDGAARGPGLVRKMAVVDADGITAASDQSTLPWGHTIKLGLTTTAKTPIDVPSGVGSIKVSTRLGPPVLGRGYMEAILDSEIERMQSEQAAREDGIHGRINRVTFNSQPNPDTRFHQHQPDEGGLIGRFGVKARITTLDDFTADAFQGDMGMTTPMRPMEPPNPDGLTDDAHPGVDLGIDEVNLVAAYLRRIAIPPRVGLTERGRAIFDGAKCSVCHVSSLRTRPDYPIGALAGIDAAVYTDMLLHDMGAALADGMTDGSADSRAFRTAPLIGLRFFKTYLHDGRATNVAGAILAHDGEARVSADAFRALSDSEKALLLTFVSAL